MGEVRQRSVALILARELAENLATPMFLVDEFGTVVYWNEPASNVLGTAFRESIEITREMWQSQWDARDASGSPLDIERMPLVTALDEKEPAHLPMLIKGGDGIVRKIAVTAYPLFARADEFIGAVAIFWQMER